MNTFARRLSLIGVAAVLVSGCGLFRTSPEKACTRAGELFGETSTDLARDHAKCLDEMTKLKKDDPTAYDCTTRCLKKADDGDDAKACMGECKSVASAKASTPAAGTSEPVDDLTPSSLKSRVASEYAYFGYDIVGEKENSAGWSATVALGKKATSGEVHVYKVVLVDVKSKDDGFKVVSSMRKRGVADDSRVGNKKALLVQCIFQRSSSQSGRPRDCGAYDERIGSFTDDLAKL